MRYNGSNLEEVLKEHELWLQYEDRGSQADFRNTDLSNISSRLRGAHLEYADLQDSDLHGCDLSEAHLMYANLSHSRLMHTNLSHANLAFANLYGSELVGANLTGAVLHGAILIHAGLRGADLSNTSFDELFIFGAQFDEATKISKFIPMACPDSGSFIGWKRCSLDRFCINSCIVKLLIPEDARRCSANGRKCRCDKAVVLEIQNMDGAKAASDIAFSIRNRKFIYKVGEMITSENSFEENRWRECSSGIHFFVNRQEAVEY